MSTTRTSLRMALTLAVIAAGGMTSGCLPLFKTEKDVYDVQKMHPITVNPDTASMSIPVADGLNGLSAESKRDVRAFLAVYKARGHGPLTVARPAGSQNEKRAGHVADDVLRLASEIGVNPVDILPQSYNAASAGNAAPVTLSFTRFVASASPCGDWSHNANQSLRNTEMPDFGCSTQNNLAASLEDPGDLVAPRGMTPSDAERRATMFSKYRKGESTITERKDDEKTEISKVGGAQ